MSGPPLAYPRRMRVSGLWLFASAALSLAACTNDGGGDDVLGSTTQNTFTNSDEGITSSGESTDEASSSEASSSESTGPKLDSMVETGTDGTDDSGCAAVSEMAENEFAPVDIIFAIDTSGSMTDEKNFVQANMNMFSQQIFLANIDSHVVMIAEASPDGPCVNVPLGSGACPGDSNPPEYLHVVQGVSSSNALDQFIATHSLWAPNIRPNSVKHLVVVSDDNASMAPATFDTMFKALDPSYANYIFHAIVAFDDPDPLDCGIGANCCQGLIPLSADIGQAYIDLAAMTGGVAGDLCLQQFGPVFDQIAQSVQQTTPLACEWDIPEPPEGQSFDPSKVNVDLNLDGVDESVFYVEDQAACGTGDGWYYYPSSADPQTIRVCPTTCGRVQSATQAQVDILFGCDTIPVG